MGLLRVDHILLLEPNAPMQENVSGSSSEDCRAEYCKSMDSESGTEAPL